MPLNNAMSARPFVPPERVPPHVGQCEADEDRDGRALHAARRELSREESRDHHHQADDRERGDESVFPGGFLEDFHHGPPSGWLSSGGSGWRASAWLMNEMKHPKATTLPVAASNANGPPRKAATTFCCIAIATTTGM